MYILKKTDCYIIGSCLDFSLITFWLLMWFDVNSLIKI